MFGCKRPLVIAHRGASVLERENTLEAFEAAARAGADMIEIDIRCTRDKVFVVHHDPIIPKSTRPISEQSYNEAAESARESGFHLPTLEETLTAFGHQIAFDIELKEPHFEKEIVTLLRRRFSDVPLVITSFDDGTVGQVKSLWPEVGAGLILGVEPPVPIKVRWSEFFPLRRLKLCGADFVVPHFRLLRLGFVRGMARSGYPVWTWTVDDPRMAKRLVEGGVAGLITNDPAMIVGRLNS